MPKCNKDIPHTCLFCSKVFSRYLGLERHMLTHTEETPYDCPVCQREFSRMDKLARHQVDCQPPVPVIPLPLAEGRVKCDSCPVTFTTARSLIRHKKLKRCKGIRRETRYSKKVKVATSPPPPPPGLTRRRPHPRPPPGPGGRPAPASAISKQRVKCDNCSGTFSFRAGLFKHKKLKRCERLREKAEKKKQAVKEGEKKKQAVKEGEKKKQAVKEVKKKNQAVKAATVLAVRRPQYKIINGNRVGSFECEKCKVKYKYYTSLSRHLRNCSRTTGSLGNVGQVCTSGSLPRHKGSTVTKKMENLADKGISAQKYTRRTPRKSGSPMDKPKEKQVTPPSMPTFAPSQNYRSRCLKCWSMFISRDFLKKHYVESHDMKLWRCKLCPEWYSTSIGLQRHMFRKHNRKMEAYLCKLCREKFPTLDSLKRHRRFHIKKKYECGICHYTFTRRYNLRKHCRRASHWIDGCERLPETPVKVTVEEKQKTPERKSKRVIKPVTPYSPSVSPVAARKKKVCLLSPDITDPKFYPVSTTAPATAIKPRSNKKLEFGEKPKPKPAQQKLDKRSKYKSSSTSSSSSLLRPPVFRYNNNNVSSSSLEDPEFPRIKLLPSPVTSPTQVQAKNLRFDVLKKFREQQQQEKQKQSSWDASFFLHMNRYNPES